MSKKVIMSKILSNNQKHVTETTESNWKKNEAALVRSGYSLEGTEVKENKDIKPEERLKQSVGKEPAVKEEIKKTDVLDKKENNSTEEN